MNKKTQTTTLKSVNCGIEFVDLGNGDTVMEIHLNEPVMFTQPGGRAGVIALAGQVLFVPMETYLADMARERIAGFPGLPLATGVLVAAPASAVEADSDAVDDVPF